MTYTVVPTDEYLQSLNIPRCSFDFDDENQLRIHLLCAMLCCPKQISDDGAIIAELVNKNAAEITGGLMDLFMIGRRATHEDNIELSKIAKNLERIFQHPLFSSIVKMDRNAKFRVVPPKSIEKLYERILRGGKQLRLREGIKEAKKEKDANAPEAVYRAKVACNFLLELIERERKFRGLRLVEWQWVQKRYNEMFINENSKDRDLMEFYENKYGMQFTIPSLNSEVSKVKLNPLKKVVKKWTGRSSVTKGFAMPLFHKIYYEIENNIVYVGFDDDIKLYTDEELENDKQIWLSGGQSKEKRFEREKSKPVEQQRGNELEGVVPLRSRQVRQATPERSELPDPVFSSPFATKAEPHRMPQASWESEQLPPVYTAAEPQYIPTSAASQNDPDSDPDSLELSNETGVFTDDEEDHNKGAKNIPKENVFGETNEWKSKDDTESPSSERYSSSAEKFDDAPSFSSSPTKRESVHTNSVPPSYPTQRELLEENPSVVRPTPRYEPPSFTKPNAPVENDAPDNSFTQPMLSTSMARHRSAFETCKTVIGAQEKEREPRQSLYENRTPVNSGNENRTRSLYERRGNPDYQQDKGRDGHSRNDRIKPYHEILLGRGSQSRSREEQNYIPPASNRQPDNDRDDYRERPYSQNSRSTPHNNRLRAQTSELPEGSVFNRQIDESCIRRNPRLTSRNIFVKEEQFSPFPPSPSPSSRSGFNEPRSRPHPDTQRPFVCESFDREDLRDYGEREEMRNYRDTDYPAYNHRPTKSSSRGPGFASQQNRGEMENYRNDDYAASSGRATESVSRGSGFKIRPESRQHNVPSPVASVGSRNESFSRRNTSQSSISMLSAEEQACLRMVRDFAFIHRNVNSSGRRTLEPILNLFPSGHSTNYWVHLIRTHVLEIELVPVLDSFVIVWKEGTSCS